MEYSHHCDICIETLDHSQLVYTLTPMFEADYLYFEIKLSFKGNSAGRSMIKLPDQWAGQKDLYHYTKSIEVESPDTILLDDKQPNIKIVTHLPNQIITLRYQLHADVGGDLSEPGRCFRPILEKEYFHFIGETSFIHPCWDEKKQISITLHWKNIPNGWTLSNSFATNNVLQLLNRPIYQLRHAVYVGGDFRIKQTAVQGSPIFVALRGCWRFSDSDYLDLVAKVVKAERAFWQDYDFPYFLITLIPIGEKSTNYIGTGLSDSFATFTSTDRPINDRLKHLLAHELFHTWNGRKIGREKPEELVYWFSEGFTNYYARLLLLRSGLMTLEEYIQDYNKVIWDYYCSPYCRAKNKRILKDFWKIRAIKDLPYQRGDILAHNWNAMIRKYSQGIFSLDNVMRDLLAASLTIGTVVSAASIDKLLQPYLPNGVQEDITRYIDNGELIFPQQGALGQGVDLNVIETKVFDLGFDYQKSVAKNIIIGIKKSSNAFKAGLRNGQQIVQRSIFFNDPTKIVRLKIRDSEGEKLIEFYPLGKKVKIPQYKLNTHKYLKEEHSNLSWFELEKK